MKEMFSNLLSRVNFLKLNSEEETTTPEELEIIKEQMRLRLQMVCNSEPRSLS